MPAKATSDHRDIDRSSGASVIGGEMLTWSDFDRTPTSFAIGRIIAAIVAERRPGQVLLAGPSAAAHVAEVPTDTALDVLVRSLPDARVVADRAGLHTTVSITCGGLDRFAPGTVYDLVVGLGGARRLLGPDSTGMSEADVVAKLAGFVAPGGALVVDATNAMGLHDLFAAEAARNPDADDAWYVGAPGYDARPPYAHEFHTAITSSGLRLALEYSAYSVPDAPTLLVTDHALADDAKRRQVQVRAAHMLSSHFGDQPALRDPRLIIDRVIASGNTGTLAPSWVVVALAKDAPDLSLDSLPDTVAADGRQSARWGRVITTTFDGGTSVAWADDRTDHENVEGLVSRDLATPDITEGVVLETALRHACADRSHQRLRQLIGDYDRWLSDNSQWSDGRNTQRFFATPDNVVVRADGRFALFDSSWKYVNVASPGDSLVHGLRRFAVRLLDSAAPHPWRVDITPSELTITLAAMAGKVVDPDAVVRTTRIDARVAALLTDRLDDVEEILAGMLDDAARARSLPSATAVGFRELLARDRVLARVSRDHHDKVAWLEGTLRMRDRYILSLEKTILGYEETLTYRTVQLLRAPRRVTTEKAKGAVIDALPPDFMERARRFAKRQSGTA